MLPHNVENDPEKLAMENIVGKGETASNQHFLHNVFYPSQDKFHFFSVIFILSSVNAFNLDQSRIMSFGKEINSSCKYDFSASYR